MPEPVPDAVMLNEVFVNSMIVLFDGFVNTPGTAFGRRQRVDQARAGDVVRSGTSNGRLSE